MWTFSLNDDEHAALVRLLKQMIEADPFPLSPRVRGLQRVLAKLEPEAAAEPYPAPKPPGQPSAVLAKKRRR
jgi:hypothetical protein